MQEEMETSGFMNDADKILKMLDDLQENNPEEYDSFIKKTLKEGKSEFTPPTFCFSIHAKDMNNNCKKFINVCNFPPIPAPKSDDEPISVYGGSTFDVLLNGEMSSVDFLGVNPKVLDEIGNDKQLKKMLVKLAIDYYNDVFHYKLSYDCGLSKKQAGDAKFLYTAFDKQNKKEEDKSNTPLNLNNDFPDIKLPFQKIDDNADHSFDLKLNTSQTNPNLIKELNNSGTQEIKFVTDIVSHPRNFVRLKAPIGFIESINDIDLEIVDDEIILVTDSFSESRCKIPCFEKIIEESIKAKFSKSKILTITIDLID